MIKLPRLHHSWHAVSVGAAVLTAVIVNHYAGFDRGGWMVLTTFLCCQTTRGTPLRQGLIIGLAIVLTVIVIKNQTSISDYLLSIGAGAAIGVVFNQLFFSIRLDKYFFQGVAPLLASLTQYSAILTQSLIGEASIDLLAEKKLQIEKSMLFKYSRYPNWVYETGFNPGLRAGWRYFLIHLEQVTEIYFSLDLLAHRRMDVKQLSEFISMSMQKNEELLDMLARYVENQQNVKVASDFTSDMTALEDALRRIVPNQIELLDISPDYMALTALVRTLRDLRGILLQLVMTLPEPRH